MAVSGFPGSFPAATSIGYLSIGAVQKSVSQAGFPGIFNGATSTGYLNIGAVQKNRLSALFRKTLSGIGSGTGKRQLQGWS